MIPTLLILAAGMGSRYGSLKQIDPVGPGGETIMDYSVFDAIKAGFGRVVFVIRKNLESDFKEYVIKKYEGKIAVDYVFQELDMVPEGIIVPADREKPWGTGHAILMAAHKVNEPFAAINADDYYGEDAYRKMYDHLKNLTKDNQTDYSMVGYQVENTLSDFGAVSRGICAVDGNNYLQGVVERTKIERVNGKIAYKDASDAWVNLDKNSIVSMNFWGFTPSFFTQLELVFRNFINENLTQLKAELYIPFVVDELIKKGQARVKVLESSAKWFGVTYKEDKSIVVQKIKELVDAGVYPAKLWK